MIIKKKKLKLLSETPKYNLYYFLIHFLNKSFLDLKLAQVHITLYY
jgi:hypothetical protein